MQYNYVLSGLEGQGVKEFVSLFIELLYFEGIKANGLVLSSRKSKLGIGLEVGFIRTGEGVLSPIIGEGYADAVYLFDINLIEIGLKYIKPNHGIIISAAISHNIGSVSKLEQINNLTKILKKAINIEPNVFIIEIMDLLYELGLQTSDEFKKWTTIFCLMGFAIKLGVIPIKFESYLASLQSILSDEKLIRLNKKVLSEVHKYVKKFEG